MAGEGGGRREGAREGILWPLLPREASKLSDVDAAALAHLQRRFSDEGLLSGQDKLWAEEEVETRVSSRTTLI